MKHSWKILFFLFLYSVTAFLLIFILPQFLVKNQFLFLIFYNSMVVVLGLYIMLFFHQYELIDLLLFCILFFLVIVYFYITGYLKGIENLKNIYFFLFSFASLSFYSAVSLIPTFFSSLRNMSNENLTKEYSPVIEQIMKTEITILNKEKERENLEKEKEMMWEMTEFIRSVNTKTSIEEVFEMVKEMFIKRLNASNIIIILNTGLNKKDNLYKLTYNLSDSMKNYVSSIEDKISNFFYLSGVSLYTLKVSDDWPETEGPPPDSLPYFLVIPLIINRNPQGFVGVFLKEEKQIPEVELNFAIFTLRNVSLSLNRLLLYEKVKNLSKRDGLTKLYLRRVLEEKLSKEIERSKRYNIPLYLIMIDVDHFKSFNDKWGHIVGDEVLRKVGANILQAIEEPFFAGRYGGEEFVIVCPSCDDIEKFAVKIKRMIQEDYVKVESGEKLFITVSMGVAKFGHDIHRIEDLIKKADEALYYAKTHGRDKIVIYPYKII